MKSVVISGGAQRLDPLDYRHRRVSPCRPRQCKPPPALFHQSFTHYSRLNAADCSWTPLIYRSLRLLE
jgi:hypothetical protein